jgi:hypothetical protein
VPPRQLGMAVIMLLIGFSLAVTGFVMDNVAKIVIGLVVSGFGSTAVNGLAKAAGRLRRRRD